jgi:hypothetical protein
MALLVSDARKGYRKKEVRATAPATAFNRAAAKTFRRSRKKDIV